MKRSINQTFEGSNLFNPAFCGLVLGTAASAYSDEVQSGIPVPLLFLILPIVLHMETRNLLPSSRSTMLPWLQENGHLKIEFPIRCKAFIPVGFDAIAFMTSANKFQMEDSKISVTNLNIKRGHKFSEEMKKILKSADLLGKWFAQSGTVGTIYSIWGVMP